MASTNMLQDIRILVTDVDGTLLGSKPEFALYRAFRLKIDEMRMLNRVQWVICTGRGLRSFSSVFLPMRSFGIVPDYVITRHAYIFEKRRVGYAPHSLWNAQVLAVQWQNRVRVARAMPLLRRAVLSRLPPPFTQIAYDSGNRLLFRFEEPGAATFAAEILTREAAPYRYLQVFHHMNEVDVRVVPFTKGLAVAALARHLRIPDRQVLVVGDGHNDISMMEINLNCRTACPANASPEVVETVHRTGGHIAKARHLSGVLEILSAYETGSIRSEFPEDWTPPASISNPIRSPGGHSGPPRKGMSSLLLFLAALYTTLLVLASFQMVPS